MPYEYSILTAFSIVIVVIIDMLLLKTRLVVRKRFWIFMIFVIILQTIVDNYLNGRWFGDGFIVGPYDPQYYSGINIFETPLENYFFGFSLLLLNISLFEYFVTRKQNKGN